MATQTNYGTNSKETISFRQTVAAATTITLKERIKAPCTIESVRVRFYRGQQLALQVIPYILHKGNRRENVITFAEGARPYLSGDDDYFIYDVVFTADYDDYIYVQAINTDATNAYDVIVDVSVDYYAGMDRVL
jgi:hypothetical protein